MTIKDIKPNKTTGADNINGDTVKLLYNTNPDFFANILNNILYGIMKNTPIPEKLPKLCLSPKKGKTSL